jgi:hypothetical protein
MSNVNVKANRLVLWPSILTRSGFVVEKWPAGKSYERMTKDNEHDTKHTTPARETVLTDEEWQLNIRQLVEKYPLPDAPWKRKDGVVRSISLSKNTRDVE